MLYDTAPTGDTQFAEGLLAIYVSGQRLEFDVRGVTFSRTEDGTITDLQIDFRTNVGVLVNLETIEALIWTPEPKVGV